MLLVKTVVKPSAIAGVGLFADQDIQQGSIVWQYTPDTCIALTRAQFQVLLNSFHKSERQLIHYYLTYAYYESLMDSMILCVDNARFVNHANFPVCGRSPHIPSESAWKYSVALRDIAKGEELTEDYRSYDDPEWLAEVYPRYGVRHEYPEEGGVRQRCESVQTAV